MKISLNKMKQLFLPIAIFGLCKLIGKENYGYRIAEYKASSKSTETGAVKIEVLYVQGWNFNSLQVPSACTHFPANAGSTSLTKCLKFQQLLTYSVSACFHIIISCAFQDVSE
jgi:hypothetical protein